MAPVAVLLADRQAVVVGTWEGTHVVAKTPHGIGGQLFVGQGQAAEEDGGGVLLVLGPAALVGLVEVLPVPLAQAHLLSELPFVFKGLASISSLSITLAMSILLRRLLCRLMRGRR